VNLGLGVVISGDRENERIVLRAHLSADSERIHAWHGDVENHKIWLALHPHGANAVGGEAEVDGVAACAQPPGEHLHHVTV